MYFCFKKSLRVKILSRQDSTRKHKRKLSEFSISKRNFLFGIHNFCTKVIELVFIIFFRYYSWQILNFLTLNIRKPKVWNVDLLRFVTNKLRDYNYTCKVPFVTIFIWFERKMWLKSRKSMQFLVIKGKVKTVNAGDHILRAKSRFFG